MLSEHLWGPVSQHPSSSQWPPWGHYGNRRVAVELSGGAHEAVIGLVLWQTLSFNSSSIYYCWDSRPCWMGMEMVTHHFNPPTPNHHISSCMNTHTHTHTRKYSTDKWVLLIPLIFKYYLYVHPERLRLAGLKPVNIITTMLQSTTPLCLTSFIHLFCCFATCFTEWIWKCFTQF